MAGTSLKSSVRQDLMQMNCRQGMKFLRMLFPAPAAVENSPIFLTRSTASCHAWMEKSTVCTRTSCARSWQNSICILGRIVVPTEQYSAGQAELLTPLTFARHRFSPLAAFTSGAYFLHSGKRWQWISKFYTASFKGIFWRPVVRTCLTTSNNLLLVL